MSKISHNPKKLPKRPQYPQEHLKWPRYQWNLKNEQNILETFENDQNTLKLRQNTLDFLDIGGTLVVFKLFCSFYRILEHFPYFSNVEGYFLIILDVWGILVIYEVTIR